MKRRHNSHIKKKSVIVIVIIIILLIVFAIVKGVSLMNEKNNSTDKEIDTKTENEEKEEKKENIENKEEEKEAKEETVNKENTETKKESEKTSEKSVTISKKTKYYKEEYRNRYIAYKEKNSNLSDEKVVMYVNIGIDQPFYTNQKESPRKNTNLILVNKFYSLGQYVPNDLTAIDSAYQVGGMKMTKDAAAAFNEMAAAAKKEGYNVIASSTYRSYSYQNNLYNNYVKKDGKTKADTYSARPGNSEHQTGLAVDVKNASSSYTNFGSTKEFTWMKEHAHEYGFILRYTVENQFITGYKSEPWHYRYVGVDVATKIKEENIGSYEEYYVMYLEN